MSSVKPIVIIAETAPVINAGLMACLARLSDPAYSLVEAPTPERLSQLTAAHPDAIVVVNPLFGGSFDPQALRASASGQLKIIAIETAPLPRTTRSLYDGTLPVTDDMAGIASRLSEIMTPPDTVTDEKDALTSREKDIIIQVVKGLTNKEIADKLFLSVHTVMTHRRNIARKLEIHSATGLTIYAIVNGLVDLSEIKL